MEKPFYISQLPEKTQAWIKEKTKKNYLKDGMSEEEAEQKATDFLDEKVNVAEDFFGKDFYKSIDAIKDNFTPPGAKKEKRFLEDEMSKDMTITKEDEERFGKEALKGLEGERETDEDEEEYYEDDGGRVYTWGELKKDIDDWVKKPDFGEQFANEDERKGYFNSDSTPNYRKIYKDFWDIGSNGAMSQISKDRAKELRDDIDTNNNGKIEKSEMENFTDSLNDYMTKNKKGRDDIPVTTRR